jgi:signal peptide peptidase SppA
MEAADSGGASVRRYPNLVQFVVETPWAILPSAHATIRDIVAERHAGHRPSDDEIRARLGGQRQQQREPSTVSTVAILPLRGVLVPRASMMTDISGATSLERFCAVFNAAVADENISAIVLDVDSPGGSVPGVAELAAEIREARGTKPIIGVANYNANSAAYWLIAQCDEVVVSPSGSVGSIGVFGTHTDVSGQLAQNGVDVTLISAGKYKVEGNPYEPLSDEARAAIQHRIDEAYGMFVADVAAGRGVSEDAVRVGYGQGRTLMAQDAVDAGLADRVAPFEDVVAELIAADQARQASDGLTTPAYNGANATTFADQATAARDAVSALVDRTRSLAEFRDRGRLTTAKRGQLFALLDSLSEAHETVAGLLADTDTDKQRHNAAGALLRARFETLRHQ